MKLFNENGTEIKQITITVRELRLIKNGLLALEIDFANAPNGKKTSEAYAILLAQINKQTNE